MILNEGVRAQFGGGLNTSTPNRKAANTSPNKRADVIQAPIIPFLVAHVVCGFLLLLAVLFEVRTGRKAEYHPRLASIVFPTFDVLLYRSNHILSVKPKPKTWKTLLKRRCGRSK